MGAMMNRTLLAAATACMLLAPPLGATVDAAGKANGSGRPNSIVIQYVAPKDPAHQPIYERLKEVRFLEKVQEFLSPFKLPRKLTFKVEGCDGDANASYDDDDNEISVCYEYIVELLGFVPEEKTPHGVYPIDALFGPLIDTCLHEFGHALFDMLELPVFGREEDAADQVAAYITLQLGRGTARRLIAGTAHAYMSEAKAEGTTQKLERFANEHGTPAQRFYNLLCIAYGADPEFSKGLVDKGYLPASRAEGCEDEYAQAKRAYERLIAPHVDQRMAKKVLNKPWLPPENTPVRIKPSQLIRRSSSE
jgi:hypothetical protein